MKNTEWVEYQDRMERELQNKRQAIRSREFETLDRTTTTKHNDIPDMRDAYAQVRAKNYQPTQDEIDFRRFTGGGVFHDNAKERWWIELNSPWVWFILK